MALLGVYVDFIAAIRQTIQEAKLKEAKIEAGDVYTILKASDQGRIESLVTIKYPSDGKVIGSLADEKFAAPLFRTLSSNPKAMTIRVWGMKRTDREPLHKYIDAYFDKTDPDDKMKLLLTLEDVVIEVPTSTGVEYYLNDGQGNVVVSSSPSLIFSYDSNVSEGIDDYYLGLANLFLSSKSPEINCYEGIKAREIMSRQLGKDVGGVASSMIFPSG